MARVLWRPGTLSQSGALRMREAAVGSLLLDPCDGQGGCESVCVPSEPTFRQCGAAPGVDPWQDFEALPDLKTSPLAPRAFNSGTHPLSPCTDTV